MVWLREDSRPTESASVPLLGGTVAVALHSKPLKKSQIKGGKHQDNTDVCDQPLPDVMPEDQHIDSYNHGNQNCNEQHDSRVPGHLDPPVPVYQQPFADDPCKCRICSWPSKVEFYE